jgi:glucose-1-phosphate adenylyltransferase
VGSAGFKTEEQVSCIILAGGQGTRLFPLTLSRCKPAVAFGGRYRLIDIPLSHALNAGIQSVYVISQYLASGLHQHILETYQLDLVGTSRIFLLSPEETLHRKVWYKGTADAIRQNLDHFKSSSVDYFLILSGDQLYNMDLHEMLLFAKASDADLVIASLPVEEADAKRMGLLSIDGKNEVREFVEKPTDPEVLKKFAVSPSFLKNHPHKKQDQRHYLGSMGIYVFKREALFSLLEKEGDDFGKDLIPLQVKKGKTSAFVYTGYWEDIGTILSYFKANLALTSRKNCLDTYDEKNPIFTHPQNLPSPLILETQVKDTLISQGSLIEGREITNSIIGFRVHVKKGTVIRNSIVMGNHFYSAPHHQSPPLPQRFFIGENCLIENAIIDEHTQIGNNVQLINQKKLQNHDGDGIFIRDGIIIVPSGTVLPDGFIL